MHPVLIHCRRQAVVLLYLLGLAAAAVSGPAAAQSLFGGKQVEVTLAARDGKPMAGAAVRVFAPGDLNHAATTGKTDSSGKFYFTADRDGFWTAEARQGDEVARVSVKVSDLEGGTERVPPWLLIGGLLLLLALAIWYRALRVRSRRPPRV